MKFFCVYMMSMWHLSEIKKILKKSKVKKKWINWNETLDPLSLVDGNWITLKSWSDYDFFSYNIQMNGAERREN